MRIKSGLITLLAVPFLVLGGAAVPASAEMHSNCWLTVTTPTTDGTKVYSASTVKCTTYMSTTAVLVAAKIQEQVLPVWVGRTGWVTNPSTGATNLSVTQVFNCNGRGTDNWRGQGEGTTKDNGKTARDGASRSLTC